MNIATAPTMDATPKRGSLRQVVYGSADAGELLAPILRSKPVRVACNFREGHLPSADLGHGQRGRSRRMLAIPAATIDRAALVGPAALHRAPSLAEIREGLAEYPELMSSVDVGHALGISRVAAWKLSRDGHLPAVLVGSGYVTKRSDLAEWLHRTIRDSLAAWAEGRDAA